MATTRLLRYLESTRLDTPVLVIDLDAIEQRYRSMRAALPEAKIYYAMKANPTPEVLGRLASLGSSFDFASLHEIESVVHAGIPADRLSFGNPIKKEVDVGKAYGHGVRLFAFDAEEELRKIARAAPGSRVFCRIRLDCDGAQWPLSRKFGCMPALAADLLGLAPSLGLIPYGLSFHVGSQQTDPCQWDHAIAASRALFDTLETDGIQLRMLNLGGGFPATYRQQVPSLPAYADAIRTSLRRHFGGGDAGNRHRAGAGPGRRLGSDRNRGRPDPIGVSLARRSGFTWMWGSSADLPKPSTS